MHGASKSGHAGQQDRETPVLILSAELEVASSQPPPFMLVKISGQPPLGIFRDSVSAHSPALPSAPH